MPTSQKILQQARLLRQQEHRLKPSLRLRTIKEIEESVHHKGLVSVFGGNELPSVISAILGREWKPSGKGFTGWYDWWSLKISGQNAGHALTRLDRAEDIVSTRIFRDTKTLVSQSLWPILDPIVNHHLELAQTHEILSQLEWKILSILDKEAPVRTDHLRSQLKLQGKTHTSRFHRALTRLEGYGLIVGHEDPNPERHLHANMWQPWKTRVGSKLGNREKFSYDHGVKELLAATINAAIIVQEKEIGKWFHWKDSILEVKNQLVDSNRILRVGSYLVTPQCA